MKSREPVQRVYVDVRHMQRSDWSWNIRVSTLYLPAGRPRLVDRRHPRRAVHACDGMVHGEDAGEA